MAERSVIIPLRHFYHSIAHNNQPSDQSSGLENDYSTTRIPRKPVPTISTVPSQTFSSFHEREIDEPFIHKSSDGPIGTTLVGEKFLYWLPELLSSVISVLALCALILVLHFYEGRGLSDVGLPSHLTINGLVALIATVNRVALLGPIEAALGQEKWLRSSSKNKKQNGSSRLIDLEFSDAASRGPLGSIMFLVRGRGGWVAHVCAIIMIVSLAFGTFSQQLLSVQPHPLVVNTTNNNIIGAIPRANSYSAWIGGAQIPVRMSAAIYYGILDPGTIPPLAKCSTGNCTWPVTPSMAVCGQCDQNLPFTSVCNNSTCVFTMSTGTSVNMSNFSNREIAYGPAFFTNYIDPYTPFDRSINKNDRADIVIFDVFGRRYSPLGYGGFGNLTSARCYLYWCVNAYTLTSSAGRQVETIVNSTGSINMTAFNSSNVVTFPPLHSSFNPNPNRTLANFGVDFNTVSVMRRAINPLLTGNGTVAAGSGANGGAVTSLSTLAIWNATGNLDVWIQSFARSLSNVIRTSEAVIDKDGYYLGTAHELGIQVRWGWIALPASMVGLSLMILVYVMLRTAYSDVYPWKSSSLMLLFADIDREIKDTVGLQEVTKKGKLVDKVGKQRVRLEWTKTGGLRFRSTRGDLD